MRRAWVQQIMGMPISIHVRSADVDSSTVARAVEEAFDIVREADRLFSTYQHNSEVSRIRRSGGDAVVGGASVEGGRRSESIWRVGIEDPRDRSRIAEVVELHHGGVATSGTAARGAHLYNPATETFVDRSGSITVVGPSLMWADIWATALFVGPASPSNRFSELTDGYRVTRQ
jgi:thiamine biosynthesis lipoprotein ApbE